VPLAHVDGLGDVAVEHLDALLEPLEQPHARIVPREDAGGVHEVHEDLRDLGHQPIDALRQRLQHEVVAVAIDDERRQPIGFPVDETIRGRVDAERAPKADRLLQPQSPQRQIGYLGPAGQQSECNFRSIAV
jgi:hypothetical protein